MTRPDDLALRCRDMPGDQDAWAALHASMDGLLWLLARRYARRRGLYNVEDARRAAGFALMRSVAGFDPARGRFATRLGRLAWQAMYASASEDQAPISLPIEARATLNGQGRRARGLSDADKARARAASRSGAITRDVASRLFAPDRSPLEMAEAAEDRDWLARSVARLDPRSAEVVARLWGLDGRDAQSHQEVAAALGIHHKTVAIVRRDALTRLRMFAAADGLLDHDAA